ncbi:unnamed protein product [Bursaphelenchus okinawaensis]|uniref:U1 small nuclear ribonucleoprotein 70 kDa n=1 Tax=Bursaphelenchus okinawaensis TaxID=465554 RepID=A0A811LD32_9BILA|nr:unnamed protein product [Bursaphelenchus okinawaensis]CAG9120946.1 unnamed protein product [Bursaphelenchus okinawaensis]
MTQFLPDNLLALFAARPPLEYKPPPDPLVVDRHRPQILGLSQYVSLFEDPEDTPAKPVVQTKAEKREERRKEKQELLAYKIEQGIAMWAPAENSEATEDPYKTLFVARISYETSESKLKREFERFGPIKKIVLVHDKDGKPRGYAFIEYEHKTDMSAAYKKADGMKIDGRRIIVDYERGRTQKTWLPRRLGGGKGDSRKTREKRAGSIDERVRYDESRHSRDRDHGRSGSRHRSRSRDRERDRHSDRNGRDRHGRDDRRDRDRRY